MSFDVKDLQITRLPATKTKTARAWLLSREEKIAGFLSPSEDEVLACETLVRGLSGIEHCLWIGIGGSSLGPKSFLEALAFRRLAPGISVRFLENPDPTEFRLTVAGLNPEKTLVCIVTKSGATFETWALALAALDWLGKSRLRTHVVAITDPVKGTLRALASREKLKTLSIPSNVGGRFSIFSPVGYLPMILEGFSAREFLRGALEAKARFLTAQDTTVQLASFLAKRAKTKPLTVFFPYGTRLREIGNWFVQLWGESLGKDGRGLTPLAGIGATDQHSLLQRLQDGQNDFVALFLKIDRHPMSVAIPPGPWAEALEAPLPALRRRTLEDLLGIELAATREALSTSKRPSALWTLPSLEEAPLGDLYFSLCVLTCLTGHFLRLNPFDQRGVEKTKRAIGLTLSKPRL